MSVLLEVAGLSRGFGGIRAVEDVGFAVEAGEIFGVIGPNGSGKTTLFNCILGQIAPEAGRVALDGADITGLAPLALARRGVGRTFQQLQVFGTLSVRENLIVAAQEHRGTRLGRLFATRDVGLGERADALIETFGLGAVAEHPAGSCSYGQQKLVDIAMAFMPAPRLVLLDEPAAGVNPALIDRLAEILRRLNRETGATFVVIEHNMDFVMSLCHRIMVMAEGRVLALGAPAAVRGDPAVIEAYLGG